MSKHPDISTSFKAIFALLWPQVLMMYVICVMNVAPIWAAGKMSADVSAALGVSMQMLFLLSVINIALNSGATAVISQSIGAKKLDRAKFYVFMTLLLNALFGVGVGVLAYIFSGQIFALLGLKGAALDIANELWAVLLFSLPCSFLFNSAMVVFRSFREVILPLIITIIVCAFYLFFIFKLSFSEFFMGREYMCLAYSNLIAQGLAALLGAFALIAKKHISASFLPFAWLRLAMPKLLKTALHSGATSIVWQAGYVALYAIVGFLPLHSNEALGGLASGHRVESFISMAGVALHIGASVVVGNCLGAKRAAEARRIAAILVFSGAAVMSVVAGILWWFMSDLAAFMSDDGLVQFYIAEYLKYNFLSTPFSIISTIFAGVMIGASAAHFNLLIFGLSFWVIRIPLAYELGHFVWGEATGVFVAMLISQVIQTALMLYVFYRVDWTKYALKH